MKLQYYNLFQLIAKVRTALIHFAKKGIVFIKYIWDVLASAFEDYIYGV